LFVAFGSRLLDWRIGSDVDSSETDDPGFVIDHCQPENPDNEI